MPTRALLGSITLLLNIVVLAYLQVRHRGFVAQVPGGENEDRVVCCMVIQQNGNTICGSYPQPPLPDPPPGCNGTVTTAAQCHCCKDQGEPCGAQRCCGSGPMTCPNGSSASFNNGLGADLGNSLSLNCQPCDSNGARSPNVRRLNS